MEKRSGYGTQQEYCHTKFPVFIQAPGPESVLSEVSFNGGDEGGDDEIDLDGSSPWPAESLYWEPH